MASFLRSSLLVAFKQFRLNPSIYNNCRSSRLLSCSSSVRGLDEFFPPGVYSGDNLVEEEPVVGRQYKLAEIRARSNVDLHKLWYVLLKERNVLLTMRAECKRLGRPMPAPTRYHKVKVSMSMIHKVIKEREQAVSALEEKQWSFEDPIKADGEDADGITEKEDAIQEGKDDNGKDDQQVVFNLQGENASNKKPFISPVFPKQKVSRPPT